MDLSGHEWDFLNQNNPSFSRNPFENSIQKTSQDLKPSSENNMLSSKNRGIPITGTKADNTKVVEHLSAKALESKVIETVALWKSEVVGCSINETHITPCVNSHSIINSNFKSIESSAFPTQEAERSAGPTIQVAPATLLVFQC